ncbi:hypothetical protein [Argonema antarcticum]|uniref:hypothetical protein n=1 Tax=Argonema antarcticum TaxID=2942763 RepID=UPI0020117AF9|nr:hypothetical protein [Argonema antarcticum]MCL1469401.1 hypothetical protein [Argonema antarcticum A004/B2]
MNQRRKNSYNSVFYLILLLLLSGCSSLSPNPQIPVQNPKNPKNPQIPGIPLPGIPLPGIPLPGIPGKNFKIPDIPDIPIQLKVKIENSLKAIETLDKGINTLGTLGGSLVSESRNWQSVLENTRKELTADVKSTIRNEITNLIDTGIASVGEEGRCNADFVGQRSRHALIGIRNNLAKEVNDLVKKEIVPLKPVETVEPAICKVIPDSVDLAEVDTNKLKELKFIGYDFNPSSIKVLLKKSDQSEVDVSDPLDTPTKYRLTLNLSRANGVQLRPTSNKLIVKANGSIISTISIIQPEYNIGLTDDIWADIYAGRIETAKAIILNKISWQDGQRNCPNVRYDEIAQVRKKVDGAGDFCLQRVRGDINAGNVSTSNAILQGVISWQNAQSQCRFMLEEEKDRVRQEPGLGASGFCR